MNDPAGVTAVIVAVALPTAVVVNGCVADPLRVMVPVNVSVMFGGVGTTGVSGPLSQADPTKARATRAALDTNITLDRRIFSPKLRRGRTHLLYP
jgi:hypothetical protein